MEAGADIRRVTLDGSEDLLLVRDGYSPAVARDGRVAFVRPLDDDAPPRYHSGQIVSVAVDGSDLRAESPALDDLRDSCFAPDFDQNTGRMVCHAAGPSEGLVLTPDGSRFTPPDGARSSELPDRTVELRGIRGAFPAIMPDGNVLSTVEGISPGVRTGTIPPRISTIAGEGLREFFMPSVGVAWGPAVARDGGWVVVAVGQPFASSDTNLDIWKLRLDGAGAVHLTADSPANDALPGISADGRTIVFRSGRDGLRGGLGDDEISREMAVYVMDGAGDNLRRLTDSDARETAPAISPDGESVVYVAFGANGAKLWISRVDGSERRLLEPDRAEQPDFSMHPSFSPDGRWVMFTSNRGGFSDEWPLTLNFQPYGDLWAVPVAGGQVVRLTNDKWEDGPTDWGSAPLRTVER